MSNWYKKSQLLSSIKDLIDMSIFEEPLMRYMQRMFSEYDPKQLLMFGLKTEDLIKPMVEKVLSLPIDVEYTTNTDQNPYAHFTFENELKIEVFGVNYKKYKNDIAKAGYGRYVDAVVYHELVHAVNYFKKLYDRINYSFADDIKYYKDPEEVRAYFSMMKDFLIGVLGISESQVLRMMNKYTTDIGPKRKEYMEDILKGK